MSKIIPLTPADAIPEPRVPKPSWLKVRAPGSPKYLELKAIMSGLGLNTVCEEARCPNIGECWHHGTATFMILGDVCTRACGYCAVSHGKPATLDLDEPARVADAVKTLKLQYVVITSVDRDDVKDGGAAIFAETIARTRAAVPGIRIEVLIPDFQGHEAPLRTVLDAGPDVLNHNTETVPRLYRLARSGGKYSRTLELLARARAYAPHIPTKTGLMVGLGETHDEVVETLGDLRKVGVEILTIGQYLRPTGSHLPMVRYYHPDEFAELKRIAMALGFGHVESGPLVRSSYHAHEQADALAAARGVSLTLSTLHREIVACTRCARLRTHCLDVAAVKRAAYRDESYWGKPLPGFGDPAARVLVVGLAPGAHGANRTGRMFTGDRSGLFLMTAMHEAGLANIPRSESRRDGLVLSDAFITAAVRCAPPDNKPTPEEFDACLPYLEAEWALLTRVAVVVTLGKLAWDATWRVLAGRGQGLKPRPVFGHGARVQAPAGGPLVLGAFHPSQQNTFTGRLTPPMLAAVFLDARAALR